MNAQQLRNSILQELIHPQEGWIERELKDIVDAQCPISYGIVQQGDHIENGVPVVRPVDLHDKYVRRVGLKCTTKEISNSYSRTILNGNEILLCVRGTTGILALATEEIKGCNVNRGIVPLFFQSNYDKFFVYYQLLSPFVQQAIAENTTGSALKQINIKELRSIKLYLPPLAEQKRIVAKIEELLPKVEEYGKAQDALNKLNEELPEKLKKSVLQEAIEGLLVPQDPNDERASVLLNRIREEKKQLVKEGKLKKKDLEETPISEDEKPFEIPESWEWVRVKEVFSINPKVVADDNADAAFIPMEKIKACYGSRFSYEIKKWKTIKSSFTCFADGDVAFAKITPCFQNRKSMILKNLPNGIGAGTTELKVLRQYAETIVREYLLYFLASSYFIDEATFKGTANQQRIIVGYLENKLFPLPPLAEQKRIVAKIEQLLGEIDKLICNRII